MIWNKLTKWAQSQSLWAYMVHQGCCADEITNILGCIYDVERFGVVMQNDIAKADVLLVCGCFNQQSAVACQALYQQMLAPKYVIVIGACAQSGGLFVHHPDIVAIDNYLAVDVFIPGNPPRPEAILDGILALQEKILYH